jgi:hypothetical protein
MREISRTTSTPGAPSVSSSCPAKCASGQVRAERRGEGSATGLPNDSIADVGLRERCTIELDASVSGCGGREASNGSTDSAVGAVPTPLALLQESNAVERVFGSISCKNRLELGLRRSDRGG